MKRAAAVIPRLADGRVLVGTRTHEARSWPGTVAFPGGAAEDTDEQLPLACGRPDVDRACALREMFEETGFLLAVARHGGEHSGAAQRASDAVHGGAPLHEALDAEQLVLDDRRLIPLCSWKTWGKAFAVRQFLLPLPEQPITLAHTHELTQLRFEQPAQLLRGWREGSTFLIAPIRRVLEGLAAEPELDAAVLRLSTEPSSRQRARMELVEGVAILSARTPTLPPATHTNSPLLGLERCLLVDPATPWDEERRAFDEWLAAALGSAHLEAIFLTHHHADHVGDAARLRQKLGVPVWAHADTASRVDVPVDRLIHDDERISLEDGFTFRALHTPGHAPGHLCLLEERTRLLVAGDMVAGVGSILIDPPDGHMGTYLQSLERLIALQPRGVIPSHGFLMADGAHRLGLQLAHRHKRQAAVLAALPDGPVHPRDLVPRVYGDDTPPSMWMFAERSVAAALELCVERGEAHRSGDLFARRAG